MKRLGSLLGSHHPSQISSELQLENFVADFIVTINFIVDFEVIYSLVDLVAVCGVDLDRNALHFAPIGQGTTKLAN